MRTNVRTPQEKERLLSQIRDLIANGMSTQKAISQVGVSVGTYYGWISKPQNKLMRKRKTKVTLVNIPTNSTAIAATPLATAQTRVALIVGSPQDVARAYQQIFTAGGVA